MDMNDIEALKIHGIITDSDSDSDSGKSEFDEEYFRNKPPPIWIDPSQIVPINAKDTQGNFQQPSTSYNNFKSNYNDMNHNENGSCNDIKITCPNFTANPKISLKNNIHRTRNGNKSFAGNCSLKFTNDCINNTNKSVQNYHKRKQTNYSNYGNKRNKASKLNASAYNAKNKYYELKESAHSTEGEIVKKNETYDFENISIMEETKLIEKCDYPPETTVTFKKSLNEANMQPSVNEESYKNIENESHCRNVISVEPTFTQEQPNLSNRIVLNLNSSPEVISEDKKDTNNEDTCWDVVFKCLSCCF